MMSLPIRAPSTGLVLRFLHPRACSRMCIAPNRAFSVSPKRPIPAPSRLATAAALKVNQQRVWDTLHYTAQWGDSKDGGVRRLALTDEDKAVREWFVAEAQKYGATVKIDEMGNLFAVRPGQNNDLPPIGIGSHLDTQHSGGRYDGILGVHAGLEVLKTLQENQYSTYAPIAVISKPNSPRRLGICIKLTFIRLDK